MKLKSVLTLFVAITFLVSCKKDALVGEYEILEGTWNWSYSEETIFDPFAGSGIMSTQIINSDVSAATYEVEFLKKGKVKFIENDNITATYRTVIASFNQTNSSGSGEEKFFSIQLNNDPNNLMMGYVTQDTLKLLNKGFPFENYSQGDIQHSFKNCFVRK